MESRVLYLEKELSLVRKKLNLLENNIQNDMKNYVDEYMKVYLEQLNTNFQNDEKVTPGGNFGESKLSYMKTERIKPDVSKIKREIDNDMKLRNNVEDFKDNVLENEYASNKTWSDGSDPSLDCNPIPGYVIVEGDDQDEDSCNAIGGKDDVEMIQTGEFDQNGEYSEEFEVFEEDVDSYNDNVPEIKIDSSISISRTSYSIPTILSIAREKATEQAEVAISSPVAASSSKSKPSSSPKETTQFPFKCLICMEVFKCASHFQKHKIKHISDRPFKCEYCNKAYKRSHHLKEHQTLNHPTEKHMVLESGRSFRCSKCPKVFTRPSLLATHMKIHSKEKMVRYGRENVDVANDESTPQFHGFTLNL